MNQRMLGLGWFIGAAAMASSSAWADLVIVGGTMNLSAAGLASAAPAGGGTLPVEIPLGMTSSGQIQVRFDSVTGLLGNILPVLAIPPDGAEGFAVNIDAFGGVSGIQASSALFLTGVFLGPGVPGGPAPASLDFRASGLGTNFASLSPLLGQAFFVGDGRTGVGDIQVFIAPAGATRLFLGIMDAGGGVGHPGAFEDNSGEFTASFQIIPAPWSAMGLLGAGLLSVRRRR